MKLLILTFGTKRHGEVIVKYYEPDFPFTREAVHEEAEKLIATYRTKRKHIPLEDFRRAKLVTLEKHIIR